MGPTSTWRPGDAQMVALIWCWLDGYQVGHSHQSSRLLCSWYWALGILNGKTPQSQVLGFKKPFISVVAYPAKLNGRFWMMVVLQNLWAIRLKRPFDVENSMVSTCFKQHPFFLSPGRPIQSIDSIYLFFQTYFFNHSPTIQHSATIDPRSCHAVAPRTAGGPWVLDGLTTKSWGTIGPK